MDAIAAGISMFLSVKECKHYRPNVGILLFNRKGKVWLGRRVEGFDALNPETFSDRYRWQMPQGGIDKGEDVAQAAFREMLEETGTNDAQLLMITPGWLGYDFPPEYRRRSWRGQRQKWAIMVFTGSDESFDLEADDHQEFDKWRWADLEEVPELIVPFKKPIYDELVTACTPMRDVLEKGLNVMRSND